MRLEGRAWSGHGPIDSVGVSVDDGASWSPARVEPPDLGAWAWQRWTFDWDAEPGERVLACRARDAAGNEQPLAATWNVGGYANNAVQRVHVVVAG